MTSPILIAVAVAGLVLMAVGALANPVVNTRRRQRRTFLLALSGGLAMVASALMLAATDAHQYFQTHGQAVAILPGLAGAAIGAVIVTITIASAPRTQTV